MTRIGTPSLGIRLFLLTGLVSLSVFMMPPRATADIYKWVDEDGEVAYSQKPPPSGQTTETIKEPPPAPTVATPPPESPVEERLEEEQQDLENDATETRLEEDNAEIRRLNCGAATRNLEALQQESQRDYVTAKGDYVRPSDKDRKKLIKETKQQIKENCKE